MNNMKKAFKLFLLLSINSMVIQDCSLYKNSNTGSLSMSVKFPDKKFAIKNIPTDTENI
ncbi:MAG: hypothetical protein H7263_16775, partial [Candidatus Sericytochromatia bacterium]|nr:hypothetical protein [Candidatus Sericytochromatia bacterium]